MARTASGAQHIEAARKLLKAARTADDLRLAQSVLLPLELGLSIEQTALAIGRSSGATCTMRTRFAKVAAGEMDAPRSKRQLRNRAKAKLERERQILDEVLPNAVTGGVIVILRVKPAIEAKLVKTLALCSVYRMLARHGWRKLAPDTHHHQGDLQARQEWKKTPLRTGRNRKEFCHQCMQLFITEIASRYPQENIVMVLDGAGWHKSTTFVLPKNLQLHFLPPYSPQLNPQEHTWDELREKYFHNQAFDSLDALEEQLLEGLRHLEQSHHAVKSIAGWDWILNCVSNAN
jgi:hypothetical protein